MLEIPAPAEGQRGELVIFEGHNGSGKTTIAEMIACAAERLLPYFGFGLTQGGGRMAPLLGRIRTLTSAGSVFVANGGGSLKAWSCSAHGHAASRQRMIDTIARALSDVLLRAVTIEFQFGRQAPVVLLDSEPIPFELLGEGLRSTLAWLSDLLVRLHRIAWANPEISPLEQDFWLILDEIDESLHPTMQMRILPALRRLFPNARMYVTTHSPFVVASAAEGYPIFCAFASPRLCVEIWAFNLFGALE